MTKEQEQKLAAAAREVANLRKTIDSANTMLRAWARSRKTLDTVQVSLSGRGETRLYVGADFAVDVVHRSFIPIIKMVRDDAVRRLRAFDLSKAV